MSAAAIPVVDITDIDRSEAALREVAAAVAAACTGSGFFYLAGHGIPAADVAAVFEANRRFHARPLDEKLPIKLNRWHRGYQPFATTTLVSSARFAPARYANQMESFFIRHEIPPDTPGYGRGIFDGPNQWPADDPAFRDVVTRFDAAFRALGHRLLRVFGVAVGESPDFFAPAFAPASTTLRLIHYPPAPATRPADLYGIHPHTDYGFLTLLAQDDVGGLEIRRPDGTWIPATPIPDTFVINVGDALARWTNAYFNSTPHRVINLSANRDRYSVAMFFDPHVDAQVACLPRFAKDGAKHPPIRYGDYYRERLEANYPDRVGVART
jgi:isopenicillin N synthase-like dioxygenase